MGRSGRSKDEERNNECASRPQPQAVRVLGRGRGGDRGASPLAARRRGRQRQQRPGERRRRQKTPDHPGTGSASLRDARRGRTRRFRGASRGAASLRRRLNPSASQKGRGRRGNRTAPPAMLDLAQVRTAPIACGPRRQGCRKKRQARRKRSSPEAEPSATTRPRSRRSSRWASVERPAARRSEGSSPT